MLQRLETEGFREYDSSLRSLPAQAGGRTVGEFLDPAAEADALRPVIRKVGLTRATVEAICQRASLNGTGFAAELLAAGVVGEMAWYAAIAEILGLRLLRTVDPQQLIVSERAAIELLVASGGIRAARLDVGDAGALQAFAPDARQFLRLASAVAVRPNLRNRIAITCPGILRGALIARLEPLLAERAVKGLAEALPSCSARSTLTSVQSYVAGSIVTATFSAGLAWPGNTWLAIHLLLLVVFIPCVLLRLFAAHIHRRPFAKLDALSHADMPRYTLLVALHRESEIVPQLLVALGRMEWPRAKLEIKLVCEADDRETLEALAAQRLRPFVEVVRVPPVGPRTKPKALAYALQLSAGELVALYDAEDRPHPHQLLEAWSRFRVAGPELACVQAPLLVSNRSESLLARMFAFEYAGLFRAMLPFLARNDLVLPLGGTSNHFRRSVLDKIGGWDPFNVTEDADLGLRMKRFGYRTETIALPTLEAAPTTVDVWLPQRTRWFKGWAQTWLVHMRNPLRLARELGPASFIVSQILFAGMLLAALMHPLLFVTLALMLADMALGDGFGLYNPTLLRIDMTVVGLGYLAFLVIGARSLPASEWKKLPLIALATPLYWLLLSAAAWRAVVQLTRAPHVWEKTPHKPAAAAASSPPPQRPSRKSAPDRTILGSSAPIAPSSRPA